MIEFLYPVVALAVANTWTAPQTFTVPAQAGVAETIATFSVGDDAAAKIEISNSSLSDTVFQPEFKFTGSSTNVSQVMTVLAGSDTLTNALARWNFKTTAGAAIATRPLVHFMNNGTIVAALAANGAWTHNVVAAALAETIATWTVSDDAVGKLEFVNAVSTNSVFAPAIRGTAPGGNQPLFLIGAATNDSVSTTNACIKFDGRVSNNTALVTKNIVEFANNNTTLALVGAKGSWTYTVQATASTGESLALWTVSDDANSYFQLSNNSATDGIFLPTLIARAASTSGPALGMVLRIDTDTGSIPSWTVDMRTNANAALITRPLMSFRNNGTSMLDMVPLNAGANAALLWNNSGLAAPTFTNRSGGTRIVLYPAVDATHTDHGIGVLAAGTSYWSIPTATSGHSFAVYGGTTQIFSIVGDGRVITSAARVKKIRSGTTTPITAALTDSIVISNMAAASAVAVTLPTTPTTGLELTIKDGKGDAGANNITISPAGGGTIDGAGTKVINTNWGAVTLIHGGSDQWYTTQNA
jgi:hypothetical protein